MRSSIYPRRREIDSHISKRGLQISSACSPKRFQALVGDAVALGQLLIEVTEAEQIQRNGRVQIDRDLLRSQLHFVRNDRDCSPLTQLSKGVRKQPDSAGRDRDHLIAVVIGDQA